MREFFVENCKNNIKLSRYICDVFPNIPANYLYKALRNKDIKVNGVRVNKDINVSSRDKISVYIDDKILFNIDNNLDIIYEDDNMLAVYKKQGILSNNEHENDDIYLDKTGILEPTLDDLVKKYCSTAMICHRLDRNTSGIIVFGKNEVAYNELNIAFKEGYIEKNYIAYVNNCKFEKQHDILEKYILKDFRTGFSKIFDTKVNSSKKIITEYSLKYINRELDYAILDIIIHTGKTHQIRSQMANILHPIIGDSMYGKNEINKKFKKYRQLLFAYKYKFNFKEDMNLYYLNNIVIELNSSYYLNKLGCELNE